MLEALTRKISYTLEDMSLHFIERSFDQVITEAPVLGRNSQLIQTIIVNNKHTIFHNPCFQMIEHESFWTSRSYCIYDSSKKLVKWSINACESRVWALVNIEGIKRGGPLNILLDDYQRNGIASTVIILTTERALFQRFQDTTRVNTQSLSLYLVHAHACEHASSLLRIRAACFAMSIGRFIHLTVVFSCTTLCRTSLLILIKTSTRIYCIVLLILCTLRNNCHCPWTFRNCLVASALTITSLAWL